MLAVGCATIGAMFNRTFFNFFFGFVAIVAVAFGILIVTGSQEQANPVDNVAQPQ